MTDQTAAVEGSVEPPVRTLGGVKVVGKPARVV
jgi:hypothetical protein